MPHGVDYNSHRPDMVSYSIPCSNTWASRHCIEESLNVSKHGVAHTTIVFEIDCPPLYWHIARWREAKTRAMSSER